MQLLRLGLHSLRMCRPKYQLWNELLRRQVRVLGRAACAGFSSGRPVWTPAGHPAMPRTISAQWTHPAPAVLLGITGPGAQICLTYSGLER